MFLIPFVVAFISILLFFFYLNYSLSFKRALLVRKMRDFRVEWDKTLLESYEYYSYLNIDQRNLLLDKISIFLNEKNWKEEVLDSQRLLVSAKACLPILNRKTNFYPHITEDFVSFTQEDWFSNNELQFEKELGKMRLREFRGDFVSRSLEYYKDPKSFKLVNEREFKLLNFYYRLV